MLDRTKKSALVTGAGGGIGRAIAIRLAKEGVKIGVLDVNRSAVIEVVAQIKNLGQEAIELVTDLSDITNIKTTIDKFMMQWDQLDVFVNSAGLLRICPLLEVTEKEWDDVVDLNLKATFFCIQAAGRIMKKQNYGRIINITSISGLGGRPDHVHYASAKAGIISLTRSAALNFAPNNITVNAICPGVVDTSMVRNLHKNRARLLGITTEESLMDITNRIPLRRLASPDEIAGVVAFLASEEAAYITGEVLIVDGGFQLSNI